MSPSLSGVPHPADQAGEAQPTCAGTVRGTACLGTALC